MKINSSFDSAFLQLQNGVNNAKKAASQVLESVGSDKVKKLDIAPKSSAADRGASSGVDVSA